MANNRIFYAIQQLGFDGVVDVDGYTAAHGVQSVGMTTNFSLDQVFELGQLAIYENVENIPEIQITASKVLDGYPLLFHLATKDAATPTLIGRSAARCRVAMSIFKDTDESANGAPEQIVESSGLYISSVSYNFPVDGSFTEDITLVGNDRLWKNDARVLNTDAIARQTAMSFSGVFTTNDDGPVGLGGVNRRENLIFNDVVYDSTILPTEIPGIGSDGVNTLTDASHARISNISVSANMGREDINELGRKTPYFRYLTLPVEVTCEIGVASTSGDLISATEEGILTTGGTCLDAGNLIDQIIRIATCEGTRIYLGNNNKLSSVNYGGGDAGGGNVAVTYSYSTFNDFTVLHSGEVLTHASGASWWTNRSGWLTG